MRSITLLAIEILFLIFCVAQKPTLMNITHTAQTGRNQT